MIIAKNYQSDNKSLDNQETNRKPNIRVHGDAANGRPDTQPSRTASFAQGPVFPQCIADLSDGSATVA